MSAVLTCPIRRIGDMPRALVKIQTINIKKIDILKYLTFTSCFVASIKLRRSEISLLSILNFDEFFSTMRKKYVQEIKPLKYLLKIRMSYLYRITDNNFVEVRLFDPKSNTV